MEDPVVVEVVEVNELPLGVKGSRRIVARWSDGSVAEALTWYSDEWLVSEGDLVGKTILEVRALAHSRDLQYLSEPDDEGQMPFFEP